MSSASKLIITDLTAYGYVWWPGSSDYSSYLRSSRDTGHKLVDSLGWDPNSSHKLVVYQAWNKDDPTKPYKIPLTDILPNYWVYHLGQGKRLEDLHDVTFDDVVNEALVHCCLA